MTNHHHTLIAMKLLMLIELEMLAYNHHPEIFGTLAMIVLNGLFTMKMLAIIALEMLTLIVQKMFALVVLLLMITH